MRGNRWFTIAREGTGSLSWLTPETGAFETKWPDRWAGIYCLLALQATSELATLSRLELAAASVVEQLNQEREQRAQGALFTRQLREDVQDLTFLMARYSITTIKGISICYTAGIRVSIATSIAISVTFAQLSSLGSSKWSLSKTASKSRP